MKTLNQRILIAFVLATLGGTLLHFVYDFFPSPITALFAPVNESIWEHLKVIYVPFLIALFILTHRGEPGSRAPWLLSLLIISALLLGVGYWYHIIYGGESVIFDIGLYVILMAIGFVLPRVFWKVSDKKWWSDVLGILVLLLGGLIMLFSFFPPNGLLFTDLSALRTWFTIPY